MLTRHITHASPSPASLEIAQVALLALQTHPFLQQRGWQPQTLAEKPAQDGIIGEDFKTSRSAS